MSVSKWLRCAVAISTLTLVSCGGGSGGSSAPPSGNGGNSPPSGSGGGGGIITPTPSPTPTAAAAPRFGFAAPFAFQSALGIDAAIFTWEAPNIDFPFGTITRTNIDEVRFLAPDSTASFAFGRQGNEESFDFRYDDIVASETRAATADPERRIVALGEEGNGLIVGPLTPQFVAQKAGLAEVAIVSYSSARTPRRQLGVDGNIQRQVFAVIGNPATEFGLLSRSKEYRIVGSFVNNLSISGTFILSADPNAGIFGVPSLQSTNFGLGAQLRVDPFIEGSHDSATNRLSGQVRDRQGGNIIGTFQGVLYGPGRNHVGLVFDIALPETGQQRHIGYAIGIGQNRS